MEPEYKPRIAVDLDGTLAEYDGWKGPTEIGHPLNGAQRFIEEIIELGYEPVVFSTRAETPEGLQAIVAWLIRHRFPASLRVWDKPYKPKATAYVDDRAVSARPDNYYQSLHQIHQIILNDAQNRVRRRHEDQTQSQVAAPDS